jgi:uncharacterized protein (DUF2147 family)
MLGGGGRNDIDAEEKAVISLIFAVTLAASQPAPEQGLWRTADGFAHVEVAPCGRNLCGTIRWLRDPAIRDLHNPTRAARSRSLVGTMVIQGLARDGGRWSGGRLYVPRSGRSYPARLRMEGRDLVVEGCRFGICRGERWTRIR